ncbi:MAG: hypothetical protein WAT71_00670 [Ignavibacteria bacterium]
MKKFKVIAAIVLIAVAGFFATQIISSDANADPNPLPHFNIKVLQYSTSYPVENAQVKYLTGGNNVYTGTTDANGWCYTTLATGTYNVYVYYPAQPLDGQSANLLNYNHDGNDDETLTLGPNY